MVNVSHGPAAGPVHIDLAAAFCTGVIEARPPLVASPDRRARSFSALLDDRRG